MSFMGLFLNNARGGPIKNTHWIILKAFRPNKMTRKEPTQATNDGIFMKASLPCYALIVKQA